MASQLALMFECCVQLGMCDTMQGCLTALLAQLSHHKSASRILLLDASTFVLLCPGLANVQSVPILGSLKVDCCSAETCSAQSSVADGTYHAKMNQSEVHILFETVLRHSSVALTPDTGG